MADLSADSNPGSIAEQTSAIEQSSMPPRSTWDSRELLGNRDEVQIIHAGAVYRLRRTRQGKLILYK